MRKNTNTILAHIVFALVSISSLASAGDVRTVTFGEGRWLDQGIRDDESVSQTAVVFKDGLTFHLTVSRSKGRVRSKGDVVGPGRLWRSGDDTYSFSLKVTNEGTTSTLESLRFRSAQLPRLNQDGRSVLLSESASKNTRTIKGRQTIEASDLYHGKGNPLTPLSKETVDAWDLTVRNTGDVLTGIGSMVFEYTAGGDPWITLAGTPEVYEDDMAVVTVTSSRAIEGLTVDDFRVANGTVKGLTDKGGNYTLEIKPASTVGESVSVSLPAGATKPSNQKSNFLQIEIVDNTPLVTLSHPFRPGDSHDPPHKPRYVTTVNDDDPATVYVAFSRPVKGLTSSDFTLKNGAVSNLEGRNDRYVLTVTPTGAEGDIIEVNLPADRVIPINRSNRNQELNRASNTLQTKIVDPTLFLDRVFTYNGVSSTTDEVEVISDLEYGRGHTKGESVQTRLHLDIYRPIDDPKNPILPDKLPLYVAVFGGGFVKGNKTVGHTRGYCEGLVQRGYVAASINYRLSNGTVNPPDETDLGPIEHRGANIAVRDMAKAIRWLRQNADTYNIDPDRIIIGGNSAGGFAVLAYGNANPGSPETAKYIEQDGETRLVQGSFKFREWEVDDFRTPVRLDVAVLHSQHGGGRPDDITQPTILVHGDSDGIVDVESSRRLSRSFEARKPTPHIHTLLEASGEAHASFNYWDYISHEKNGKNYEEHWVEFLFEHLNLAKLLTDSPRSMETTTQREDGHLKTSIKYDDRIGYQLTKSTDGESWSPVAGEPVSNNGRLEMTVPSAGPKTVYRWELRFDHEEITNKDYSR